ncbi:MAG: hydrolase 1, exosortase A system-associated [Halioglobus sp.]|nr:hydrolase 1, exosortase A system-associated [Halioglobus sp.]
MAVRWKEQGLVFPCGDNRLVGIAALPESRYSDVGVVLLVGGPQYRVGSHRQFTQLARDLAGAGIPSLRFDYTGMGDSEGEQRDFSAVEQDIGAAISAFTEVEPGVRRIVLWGLCDAASSAMMFAHRFPQVRGMVLLNPWVHGADYSPEVKLSHYYRPLFTAGENWRRLLSGKIDLIPALKELFGSSLHTAAGWVGLGSSASRHLAVDQMLEGMREFASNCLIILSEDDLTAKEFSSLVDRDKKWQRVVAADGIVTHLVAGADHTFSTREWKSEVSDLTLNWVRDLPQSG